MIPDPKVACGLANQWEPLPERVRIVYFLFFVQWPNHPSVFSGSGRAARFGWCATKGCRRSGTRRQRRLTHESGDTIASIVFHHLGRFVEWNGGGECPTMSCDLAVSCCSGPLNVGFRFGGWKGWTLHKNLLKDANCENVDEFKRLMEDADA